jgi:hypothetical protein
MVPDLEDIDIRHSVEQFPFHTMSDVAGEQEIETAESQVQDERVLVGLELSRDPRRCRMEHGDRERIHDQRIPRPPDPKIQTISVYGAEIVEVEARPQRLSRLDHDPNLYFLQHRGHATQVVGIAVRDEHGLE